MDHFQNQNEFYSSSSFSLSNHRYSLMMNFSNLTFPRSFFFSINLINGTVMTLANESTRQLCYVLMPHRSLLCMADSIR